nr:DUF389 domain-containing protein [uncultured Mogibacterium sp.]
MKKFFYTLWICLYPILIYTAIQLSLGMLMGVLFSIFAGVRGPEAMENIITENALVITAICAVVTSVFLSLFFYLDINKGRIEKRGQIRAMDFVMAILGGAGVAIASREPVKKKISNYLPVIYLDSIDEDANVIKTSFE